MKKLLVVCTLFLCFSLTYGQEIEMKTNFFSGHVFYQDNERLSWKELVNRTASNAAANELIRSARTNNTLSNILAFSGGALTGIPIGQSITDKDPNWTLAYVGAGVGAIGIIISIKASKKAKEGIEVYNSSLNQTSSAVEPRIEFKANTTGIGFILSF